MTRTEARLVDALGSIAASIPDQALRPLAPALDAEPGGRRLRRARRLTRWLAPVSSALAVLAVVGIVLSLAPWGPSSPRPPFRDAATATAPPPYYVSIVGVNANVLQVQVTATGRVTDQKQPPRGWYVTGPNAQWIQPYAPSAVAAGGDLVFVVAYNNPVRRLTAIYRFALTRAGQVTGFRQVPGGVVPAMADPALAVTADGSRVAIAGIPAARGTSGDAAGSPSLYVIDMRSGARTVWRGGLARRGWQLTIPSVAWTPDGRSLVFVAQRCRPNIATPQTASCQDNGGISSYVPPAGPVGQVQEIGVTGSGGRLDAGRVLLRGTQRFPAILQALVSPAGHLIALIARGTHAYLLEYAMPSGRLLRMLSNGSFVYGMLISLGLGSAELTADGSGRYLIESFNLGTPTGWVARGRYHYLRQGNVPSSAW